MKRKKIKASSGGPASFCYRTCENIQFFCDDYSRIRVVQKYPWEKIWTVDEFVEFYDSFHNDTEEIENYIYTVEKYEEINT